MGNYLDFITPELIAELDADEGYRSKPYLDTKEVVTIGKGHNLEAHPEPLLVYGQSLYDEVKKRRLLGRPLLERLRELGMEWTRQDADYWRDRAISRTIEELTAGSAAFRHLVAKMEAGSIADGIVPSVYLPAKVRAQVLINLCFNIGLTKFLTFARMQAAILADNYEQAAWEMLWNKPGIPTKWSQDVGPVRSGRLARQMETGMRT